MCFTYKKKSSKFSGKFSTLVNFGVVGNFLYKFTYINDDKFLETASIVSFMVSLLFE